MPDARYVISGCSGGGKSTLLAALAARGHALVPEPGRRVIAAGRATPWDDPVGFAQALVTMAQADLAATAALAGPVFFDRGLIDAVAALAAATGVPAASLLPAPLPYARRVFFLPPWPELFEPDTDRRHGFDEALAEHARLEALYPALGYQLVSGTRLPVAERADFVLAALA